MAERNTEGGNTGDGANLVESRSFLVIGYMSDLCGSQGNRIDAKFRSFKSFRSNLKSPEVLTFDELVERARWNVELAEKREGTETEVPDFEF
ncbi:Shedu anti-phage system protein SduA domain-containing protein [Corynebacterium marquesiae]|uniref:Shedu anti-phage system protein SduA domain-containing protein n=1 Tax=Corynebacterium marquesiae TaxID=2913503 RepID=UPI0038D00AA6